MKDDNPISEIELKQPPDKIVNDCTIDTQGSDSS